MATRISYENSSEVGVFAKLTNKFCLIGSGRNDNFLTIFEDELSPVMPVIQASIGQCRIVGRLTVANSKGLLVPSITTEMELQVIKESLPEGVRIQQIDERLSALGNVIACNDHVALVHPEVDLATEEIIQDVLGVETYKTTIAGQPLVGSYCCLTNKGGLVHPLCSVAELDALASLVQVPLCAGTVNRGNDQIGTGMVVNDWTAFTGVETTATELSVIEAIFKIADSGKNVFAAENRTALIDNLN